jgi:competence protein ComEA
MRTSSPRLALAGTLAVLIVTLTVPTLAVAAQQANTEEQGKDQIEINSATQEDLQRVPGIGPTLAARIIDFREEHGPFERIEDLLNVQGIGVRTLERMRPYLKVEIPKTPK